MLPIHEIFAADHTRLRQQVDRLQQAWSERSPRLDELFAAFQQDARAHFRKEDQVYYPHVDGGKQMSDRALMHELRNDHAAVVFALESLAIRLRKKVPLEEWKVKFDTMIKVLLPHFDHEEKKLFPEVERVLKPAELAMLLEKIQALE